MLMRLTRKIVIVGIAAFIVQRLFEFARARVGRAMDRATPHLHDALDRARSAADDVASDVNDARQVLKDAAQDVSSDLADAAHQVRAEAESVVLDSEISPWESSHLQQRRCANATVRPYVPQLT